MHGVNTWFGPMLRHFAGRDTSVECGGICGYGLRARAQVGRGRAGEYSAMTEEITMPAYWVARSKINDPVEYKKYTDLVPAIIAKHGGKVLARGGRYEILEGPQKFQRFIVIEFPTFEQGVACFKSD